MLRERWQHDNKINILRERHLAREKSNKTLDGDYFKLYELFVVKNHLAKNNYCTASFTEQMQSIL